MFNLEIFDNDKIISSKNTDNPPKTGLYLVLAYDQALEKNDYFLSYYREDTKKFYLQELTLEDFTDKW